MYPIRSMGDFSFEQAIIAKWNCEVHSFDCTIGSTLLAPQGVQFHPWCIGERDEAKLVPAEVNSPDIIKRHENETAQVPQS